jgi:hypothetical protein
MRVPELPMAVRTFDRPGEIATLLSVLPGSVEGGLPERGAHHRQAGRQRVDAHVLAPPQFYVRKRPGEFRNRRGRSRAIRKDETSVGGHKEAGAVRKVPAPRGRALAGDVPGDSLQEGPDAGLHL